MRDTSAAIQIDNEIRRYRTEDFGVNETREN